MENIATRPNGVATTIGAGAATGSVRPDEQQRTVAQHPRDLGRTRFRLLLGIAVVLALTLGVGGIYTKTQLDDRDATITDLRQDVATLSTTSESLQTQVTGLTGERDALTGQVTQLTAERDTLTGQVADLERQLTQAREEASRQQGLAQAAETRATDAEALTGQLQTLVTLDTEIQTELLNLSYYLSSSMNNYFEGNYEAMESDLDQVDATLVLLDVLLPQRAELLAEIAQ